MVNRPDGTLVVAWPRSGMCWIQPRQRQVAYVLAPRVTPEGFLATLLGPVISYLLLVEGYDPLHASALRVGKEAVCFLGQPGAGKSTLAAAFVLAGHGLIAEDVLAIQWTNGWPQAVPGYPEIRLWPGSGTRLLPQFSRLPRVVPTSSKRRLDPRAYRGGFVKQPVPIRVFYEIRRSSAISTPRSLPLSHKDAFLALIRNLYNAVLVTPEILERQFHWLGTVSRQIPVRRLLLPRTTYDPLQLPRVILNDLRRVC